MVSGCACAPGLAARSSRPGAGRAARASASDVAGCDVIMLPAAARMRRSADFAQATRGGSKAGRPLVSGHLLVRRDSSERARVGFVVSKAVGSAVVRNTVRRRLRHLARGYLRLLPGGSLLVVRAAPRAATACQADLAADLDLVIGALLRRQGGVVIQ
jgi:ribonuclease P protein component